MKTKALAVCAGLGVAVASAYAGDLYMVDDSTNTLLRMDTSTLQISTIGPLGTGGDFGDLAYDDRTGTMFYVGGRSNNALYTINLATGAATHIGNHGVNDMFTLAVDPSGQLFGQATNGTVYTIDRNTGAATSIGSNSIYPGGYDWSGDLGEIIFLEAGGGRLFTVDRTNGAATEIHPGQGFVDDNDIAWDWDMGVYWVADWSGDLYQYSTSYSRTLMLSGLPPIAAVEYIPAPGTALVLGIAGLAAVRRRR